jgi:hypothetical protein
VSADWPIRAVRVVNGIGKVKGYMAADNEQLARLCFASPAVTTKTHFTSCIVSEVLGKFPV